MFWDVWEPFGLAAPQCVAGFGVRLDLHIVSPCPWKFFTRSQLLVFWDGLGKPFSLAAPQYVACLGVCLDLHESAPFLGFACSGL